MTESIGGAPGVTRGYRYDLGGRLEAVTDSAGNPLASYTYDANGNRTTAPGVALGDVIVDEHDQLWAYGARTFDYTLNGEVASVSEGTGRTDYTWDSLGVVSIGVGLTETFGYHPTPAEATALASVEDIVRLLEAKGIVFDD